MTRLAKVEGLVKTQSRIGPRITPDKEYGVGQWRALQDEMGAHGVRPWVDISANPQGQYVSYLVWNSYEVEKK